MKVILSKSKSFSFRVFYSPNVTQIKLFFKFNKFGYWFLFQSWFASASKKKLKLPAKTISQQTFVLMKTSWRRLEDLFRLRLQKTSSRRLQDVLIKTNMFALALRLQKTSWSRPIYLSWPYVFKTSSRRLQDVFKTSSRRFQDVLSS